MRTLSLLMFSLLLLVTSCGAPQIPSQSTPVDALPSIMPDYTDVTIPSNICPLNFCLQEAECSEVVARLSSSSLSFVYGKGTQVLIDPAEWSQLIASARGADIQVEVWGRQSDGWHAYRPFSIHVADDEIDSYISYRLIPPSYVAYEELSIEQRNLTNFETREIYNNMKVSTENKGQCINCHSFQNYHTQNFLFHVRQGWGGTMIVTDGKIQKVDLKRPGLISAGVYPSWHPSEALIAFSTNNTAQTFHTVDTAKVEVFDSASDLILYDLNHDKVITVSNDSMQMETFPTWSPDGRWLYFCSAAVPFDPTSGDLKDKAIEHYQEIRYDLYRKSFDPATLQFGPTELVYQASADTMSVTLPRFSPDGRYLTFARASFGCFHVWHPDADIVVIDLERPVPAEADTTSLHFATIDLSAFNTPDYSESYPSFSSTGRWLMCDSRRDDGNFTRPYIAYFDEQGHVHKPFEVPQQTPAFYQLSLKSFNRPEFTTEAVQVSCGDIAEVVVK